MRNEVSKALVFGILTFLLSLGSCLEIGDGCGSENKTCTMAMNCLQENKMLAENYDESNNHSYPLLAMEIFRACGKEGEEFLFCCHSPLKLEVVEDVSEHPNLGLLRQDICGPTPTGHRIVNGEEAKLNEFPWMALLTFLKGQPWTKHCGGSIISNRYVLTAAHCVQNFRPRYVWVGEHNYYTYEDCKEVFMDGKKETKCTPKPQEIPIEEIIIHPNFMFSFPFYHDIALLRLSHDVNFTSDAVKPVCLPIGLEQQKPNLIGRTAEIVGWGITEKGDNTGELRKATVPIHEYSKCPYLPSISSLAQICAGDFEHVRTTNRGDSGGPLTLNVDVQGVLRAIQYGIVSSGPDELAKYYGSLYTHVGHYIKWILDNMKP